ncbi:FAD-dependent oxidoreductase [candidate division KSB1 bacterium]|nr:FAD-dependent oxidoreductase [candidate division KSB1 bacterium]
MHKFVRWWRLPIYTILIGILFYGCQSQSNIGKNTTKAEVIIYGSTAAAITAAVQVTKMGKSVLIVAPYKHLGGLSSSGLGFTDTGKKGVIGGLAREFYHRVYKHYQKPESWTWQEKDAYGNVGQGTPAIDGENRTMWIFEPHVAENIFEDFVKEYKIPVLREQWLDRKNGVKIRNGKIISIATLSGETYEGTIFIDATYEGDLMAAAGVSFHVGRESNAVYQEEWNGIQTGVFQHSHNFGDMKISPYKVPGEPSRGILPRISNLDPGIKGEGDNKIQAYCFRTCLTKNEENRIPFEKPDGYDPSQYELLLRVYDRGWNETFRKFDPIPNLKTDVNNHGPLSFDNIGMNYDFPEASYERRNEIIKEHETYQKGLLYFITTDPRVPQDIQEEMRKWGLAKDEFVDNGHWPYRIYIREARRMIGEFVMTEHEILGKKPVEKSIGMGSYTMDSHNTQRYITPDGYVQNEGDIGVRVRKPYQIELGTILPQKDECTNLLVPVAVSSSHIAFGSIRMEPVFMVLGQSAGTIAALAVDKKSGVQDVPYDKIKAKLIEDKHILELNIP